MHAFIISDILPDKNYAGGQVLHKIIENLPEIDFNVLWINQFDLPSTNQIPENSKVLASYKLLPERHPKSIQAIFNKIHSLKILRPISFALNFFSNALIFAKVAIKIKINIWRHRPDLIWLILQGDKLTLIFSALFFFNKGKVLILHQWDPMSWWLKSKNRPQWFIRLIECLLNSIEKKATLNLVPSLNWKNKLLAEKKNAYSIDNFIDNEDFDYPFIHYKKCSTLNAVFIGQRYANNELIKICEALRDFGCKNEFTINIHYFGSSPVSELAGIKVTSYGFLDPHLIPREISIYDLAILPYPIDPSYDEVSSLSFPSKCRQYLAAGLPILAIAPIHSGVHEFLDENLPETLYCNLVKTPYPSNFLKLIANSNYREKSYLHAVSKEVGMKYFSESSVVPPFKNLLSSFVSI